MPRQLFRPGSSFGPFEVLAPVGRGAMAEVYLARDRRTGAQVALKVLRHVPGAERSTERRFEREARAIAATRHPSIVTVHEVGWHEGLPFIAMEYVDGGTLRDLLDEGRLPLDRVLAIGAAIAEALASAHEAGIVHRDLKPENVMLTRSGEVKVLDFGLSKPLDAEPPSEASETAEELTLPGTILGTLEYMSPEQASGYPADYRADQFALGAILYEMATGVVAFKRDTMARTLAAVIEGAPHPAGSLGPLEAVVTRALSKAPAGRFASMRDMAVALRRVREEAGPPRHHLPVALGVVLALAGAATLLL